MLIGVLPLGAPGLAGPTDSPLSKGFYAPHPPALIQKDADFTVANGVKSGTGAAGDPFVIDGWQFDGSSTSYGLYIANTRAHFKVMNNSFVSANGNWQCPPECRSGLIIHNSTNGTVTANSATGNYHAGILLWYASGIRVVGNTVSNNVNHGMMIHWSNNTVILNNTGESNVQIGVVAQFSNYLTITNNTMRLSGNSGIHVWSCRFVSLTLNSALQGQNVGLSVEAQSFGVLLSGNRVELNADDGIRIGPWSVEGNITVESNAVRNNSGDGIELTGVGNYTVRNNDVEGAGRSGITAFSHGNRILDNRIASGSTAGIVVWGADSNLVSGNTVSNASGAGLHLYQADANRVTGNSIVARGADAIRLSQSNSNLIDINRIEGNSGLGAVLQWNTSGNGTPQSSYNRVVGNRFIGNNGGGVQAADNGLQNNWNWSGWGNYWSDFDAPSEGCWDNNTDSVCDAPYAVAGSAVAKDRYPSTTSAIPESAGLTAGAIGALAALMVAGYKQWLRSPRPHPDRLDLKEGTIAR